MKRILTTGVATLALTVPLALATAAPASAAGKPAKPGAGGECVQDGLETLRTLGLFGPATKKAVDYSDYTGPDLIRLDLPSDSNLSLGKVVSLHATNPAVFGWCTPAPATG